MSTVFQGEVSLEVLFPFGHSTITFVKETHEELLKR